MRCFRVTYRKQNNVHLLQGILLESRPLLLAVAPAASPNDKSAAALTMATSAAAALQATGMATTGAHPRGDAPVASVLRHVIHGERANPWSSTWA